MMFNRRRYRYRVWLNETRKTRCQEARQSLFNHFLNLGENLLNETFLALSRFKIRIINAFVIALELVRNRNAGCIRVAFKPRFFNSIKEVVGLFVQRLIEVKTQAYLFYHTPPPAFEMRYASIS